jgi:hypothetical protein
VPSNAGTAAFRYTGPNPGIDTLQATVAESGNLLVSGQGKPDLGQLRRACPPGSIALSFFAVLNDDHFYTALVTDASGNPMVNTSPAGRLSG